MYSQYPETYRILLVPMRSILRIVTATKELKNLYIGVTVFSILVALANQVQPLLIKTIVDEITKLVGNDTANVSIVVWAVVAIFVADVATTLFSNIGGVIGDMLQVRLKKILSERYFEHLMKLPQSYFDQELSGTIVNRLNRGIDQISSFMQAFTNNFLQFVFTTVLSLGIIFFYSWEVGIMLAALYPIFIWLTTRTSGKWREYQNEINMNVDVATGRFSEAVNQIKVVKSFGREADEQRLFSQRYKNAVTTTWPQTMLWHKQDVGRRLVLNVIFLGVYAFICVRAAQGEYSIGTMVLLIQYATLIRIPIFSISFIVDQSQKAVANSKDYFEAMDVRPETNQLTPHKLRHTITHAEVVFDDVQFSYEEDNSVLRGVSFALKTGTRTALVGESGEGKTTITNLLLGLYSPNAGAITIDGHDITQLNRAQLRNASAVVFQEPALFSGTIYENIAYGKPGVSKKAVEQAARDANAHGFIEKFSKGYDTEIGERGLKLSGGQKQRIAIARAILKDAPLLILDEATSSLDSKSEFLVQQALERLMQHRTVLVIAHRLSTIQSMDTIIGIKNGRVVEQGSPTELAKGTGIYASLLELQNLDNATAKKRLLNYEIKA